MKVGNQNHCAPAQHSNPCGEGAKAKGGSGEKAKGGSGEKFGPTKEGAKAAGMNWGQYKKQFQDGFEGGQDGNSQGVQGDDHHPSLFGGIGDFLQNLFGGWGKKDNQQSDSVYQNYAGSTPQAVAQKTNNSSMPVIDPANLPPKDVAAKALPGISQMDPTGKTADYKNAEMNCGPTVLAMIGDAFGKKPVGMSDADYISKIGTTAGTTGAGTTGNGMIAALNDMGFQTAANKGGDLAWINNQLGMGHEVIADGDYYSMAAHPNDKLEAGHYVAVTAYTGGQYTVNDPANGTVVKMSPQELSDFIAHHPQGGFTLAAWPDPTAAALPMPVPVPAPVG